MTKKINLICLALALLISTAVICTGQSWGESSWGNSRDWTTDINSGSDLTDGNGNNQNTDSWGSPTPAEVSEPSEGAYFPTSNSESTRTLIEETTSTSDLGGSGYPLYAYASASGICDGGSEICGSSKNIFWIVCGNEHRSSVDISCNRYARLLIIPSTSGQLIMEEKYPDGHVQTYSSGYVKAQKQYKMWFFADKSGIHQMRYRIGNGPYSNILTFHVDKCGYHPLVCPCCNRPY